LQKMQSSAMSAAYSVRAHPAEPGACGYRSQPILLNQR